MKKNYAEERINGLDKLKAYIAKRISSIKYGFMPRGQKSEQIEEGEMNLKKYCRSIGLVLVFFGIFHFVFPSYLDSSWGVPLIAVGIFSLIFRKRFTLVIYGITLVLVGILNSLPLLSPESEFGRWGFVGILQIYWGITEFIKFYKIKDRVIESDIKPIFQWIALVLLVVVFLFYIDSYFSSYSIYKTIDGEEVLVDSDSCKEPYVELNYRCCIPSENFIEMCKDEAEDYDSKMQWLIESDQQLTTKKRIIDKDMNISFDIPEGYLLIEDTKEGGISVPYHLMVFGIDEDENYTGDMVDIRIYNYRNISQRKDFWDDILDDVYRGFDEDTIKEGNTSHGYDVINIETVDKIEIADETDSNVSPFFYYQRDVVFKERELWITFYTNEGLKYMMDDFDSLINSIVFE